MPFVIPHTSVLCTHISFARLSQVPLPHLRPGCGLMNELHFACKFGSSRLTLDQVRMAMSG